MVSEELQRAQRASNKRGHYTAAVLEIAPMISEKIQAALTIVNLILFILSEYVYHKKQCKRKGAFKR